MRRMNKILSKLHKDEKGFSIITAIVAIGFVLVLVSVILTSVTVNFKMRNMNIYATDSFYSAEQVLDEIKVGLEQLAQQGLSDAYTNVLTTYTSEDYTAADKNELVKAQYYNYICKELGLSEGTTSYICMAVDDSENLKGLYKLLKSSTRWHGITKENSNEADVQQSYGAFIRGKNNLTGVDKDGTNTYVGTMQVTNTDGIYLKDLVVYYRDTNGFVSTVETDIHIVYPNFSFSNPSVPEISNYAFITDTALVNENGGSKSAATYTNILGNTYAYAYDLKGNKLTYLPSTDGDNLAICATEINITNGSLVTNDSTELWAEDINVKSSDVFLAGKTYVLDDLDLNGKDCNLLISGYYTGYGNSVSDPNESSAILVNGSGCVIDLQAVKKLTLAGRAFVDVTNHKDEDNKNKTVDDTTNSLSCFYTGESIAVKSNQLMYLVPGECIGVDEDNNSKYNKNPLTSEELKYIKDSSNGLTEVSLNKPVTRLGSAGNTLGEYLDTTNPVEKVFLRTSDGSDTIVYYYMNFASEDAANLYFAKYYGMNYDSVDKYMKTYLEAITLPSSGATMRVSLAGNTVADNIATSDDGTLRRQTAGYLKEPDYDGQTISESFSDDYETYVGRFEGLCTKLSTDLESLKDEGATAFTHSVRKNTKASNSLGYTKTLPNSVLFDNLVNADSFKEIVGGSKLEFKDAKGNVRAILIHGSSEYDVVSLSTTTTCNLIIADCGVELSGNSFDGLILAKGAIKVSGNFTFTADSKKVDECLNLATDDGVYYVYEVFSDKNELQYITNSGEGTGNYKAADLVEFTNWTKSVDID